MDIVGSSVRKLRLNKGLRQKELAAKAGMDPSNLSKLERGEYTWTKETLQKLADALDSPQHLLFTDVVADNSIGNPSSEVTAALPAGYSIIQLLDLADVRAFIAGDPLPEGTLRQEFAMMCSTCSERSFAVMMKGDAMLPLLQPGDVVVIDPLAVPRPGQIVLALESSGEAILRHYADRGLSASGQQVFELVPARSEFYPTLNSTVQELRIVGVARQRVIQLA